MAKTTRPKHIYFLLLPGAHALDLGGPAQVLSHPELDGVTVHYLSAKTTLECAQHFTLTELEALPASLEENSWLLLVGNVQRYDSESRHLDEQTIKWLKRINLEKTLLCCICSGAVLAARAGLLDGQNCTTHHSLIKRLKKIAPQAHVLENRIFVGEKLLWTSAGISTGIDLCLHLVSIYWGNTATQKIAHDLVIYHRRAGHDEQNNIWLSSRNHMHDRIHQVQSSILERVNEEWSMYKIAQLVNVSPRHLSRLFRSTTGFSVNEYIQRARIEKAKSMLLSSNQNIMDIANECGFGSERQFRRQWNKCNQVSPKVWRNYQLK